MSITHNLALLTTSSTHGEAKTFGLAHWMRKVLEECDRTRIDFAPDPVHDLRVALRRCRSMADGLMTLDSHSAWKQMKKASKQLFSRLGELRDVHVMVEWIERLGAPDDPVSVALLDLSRAQEETLKQEALAALDAFNRKRWEGWSAVLTKRAERIAPDSPVFRHLALERWHGACQLHQRALRNRTKTAFHQLRIGLKKFRYTVENFLPELHAKWKDDLKTLQDALGEVHDLDVLWATALKTKVFPDADARAQWRTKIETERAQRLQAYKRKMVGPGSLWQAWRTELPQGAEAELGALQRLKTWAVFLDPDTKHAERVTRFALQIYDGLASDGRFNGIRSPRARPILQAAALLHDVGRAKRGKNHHKISARWIRKLSPPLGWRQHDLQTAALVARYHRGALPGAQKRFATLSDAQKHLVASLAGILRLAESLDWDHKGKVRKLSVDNVGGFVTIWVQGNLQEGNSPERVAGARYLLEVACNRPVLVRQREQVGKRPDRTPPGKRPVIRLVHSA